ncbi:MAG: two-component sensor histidine kinase [Saprospiraceae bacterium]
MSNSLKYAFPEKCKSIINVSLSEIDQSLVRSVKDDGIRVVSDQQNKLGSSFGCRLISVLRDQLNDELNRSGDDDTLITMTNKKYMIAD